MIYEAVVYKDPASVKLPPDVDATAFVTEETSNRDDFETNYKALVKSIDRMKISDKVVSYPDFKALISEHLLRWDDVECYENDATYHLFLELFPIVAKTNAPLSAGETWESDVFSTAGYSKIVGSIYSDARGILWVMQRNDGQNWDAVYRVVVTPRRSFGFSVDVMGNEGKIRFKALQSQNEFRLYARLRRV